MTGDLPLLADRVSLAIMTSSALIGLGASNGESMAKHWAVIIGVNQYSPSLQPLMFAQLDAIELYSFFVEEIGWPQEQCLLFTDILASSAGHALEPSLASIQARLRRLCLQTLTSEDTLWVFFSGYGMVWEGQDYLLPTDGDPEHITETGLPTQFLLEQLKAAPTSNILVLLDMNRSQLALPNQPLGAQTLELAKSLGIPLILSCQPEQFSQETLAVRHGLFTAALLEGMRFHGCLASSQLANYLSDRVPELCTHHWRPPQNPLAHIPTQQQFMLLIPPEAVTRLPLTEAAMHSATNSLQFAEVDNRLSGEAAHPLSGLQSSSTAVSTDSTPTAPNDARNFTAAPAESTMATRPTAKAASPQSDSQRENKAEAEAPVILPMWQRWSLVIAAVLLLGVLFRNQTVFMGQGSSEDRPMPETSELEPSTTSPNTVGTAVSDDARSLAAEQFPLDQGRRALEEGNFQEALNWLEQVPMEQRSDTYQWLWEQAQRGYTMVGSPSQAQLATAQQEIRSLSASQFSDAIEQAQQISAEDPNYYQAQEAIQRWSQVILDLAKGRAAANQFHEAISAAQLVPQNSSQIHSAAQERIAFWQQRLVNRDVLKQAQLMLAPNQAATFQQAIALVAPISPAYPEYPLAQERITQWSQDILVIAQARAAQGDIQGAIAAAQLVPEGTVAYETAQQQLQAWRELTIDN